MSTIIAVSSVAITVCAVVISVYIGAAEVRRLRKRTGDTSRLTSILGGTFFHRVL